jgi:hypothetical protein
MPDCVIQLGDRQTEKKLRNCDRREMCNATPEIAAGRGVIHHWGVSDPSDWARPLRCSHSTWMEFVFAEDSVPVARGNDIMLLSISLGAHIILWFNYSSFLSVMATLSGTLKATFKSCINVCRSSSCIILAFHTFCKFLGKASPYKRWNVYDIFDCLSEILPVMCLLLI